MEKWQYHFYLSVRILVSRVSFTMSPTLVHNRMQSSTRMDVLSKMLSTDSPAEKALSNVSDSPRDSLSPLDDRFNDDDSRKGVELARTASTDDSKSLQLLVVSSTKILQRGATAHNMQAPARDKHSSNLTSPSWTQHQSTRQPHLLCQQQHVRHVLRSLLDLTGPPP